MKNNNHHNFYYAFVPIFTVVGLLCLTFLFVLGLYLTYSSRVYPNISLSGISLSHLTHKDATHLVSLRTDKYLRTPITLSYNDQQVQTTPRELGMSFDVSSSLAPLKEISTNKLWREKLQILLHGKSFSLVSNIDDTQLDEFVYSSFSLDLPEPVDATLAYNEKAKRFDITESTIGTDIDIQSLKDELLVNAEQLTSSDSALHVMDIQPRITAPALKLALADIAPFLDLPRVIVSENHEWPISPDQLKEWISFDPIIQENGTITLQPAFNELLLVDFLTDASKDLGELPRNARLGVDDNDQIVVLQESVAGKALYSQDNIEYVSRNLLSNTLRISLSPQEVLPEVRSETLKDLGIVGLVGHGSSDFKGSPADRVHNIRVGASKFDGVLLEPGEIFSFNNILGSADAKDGFVNALVIQGKDIVPSMGGGLCQVSTTAFRAAAFSGLEIVERFPHSFHVSYYGDPGFDATVWLGGKDFRFKNDTPGHLYVQTEVVGSIISFSFFGTPDHRKVDVSDPVITAKNANGSMHTLLTRHIVFPNGKERTEEFTSFYKPRSAFSTAAEKKKKEEEEEKKRLEEEQQQQAEQQIAGDETEEQPES